MSECGTSMFSRIFIERPRLAAVVSLILLLAEMGVMVNIGRNGERARLEREVAHAERERQRKAKTIVLDTARRARTEQ